MESLENGLWKAGTNKELIEKAEVFKLWKIYDSTGNPNWKDWFGFSLVFFKYREELQREWRDFLCTVRNGFFKKALEMCMDLNFIKRHPHEVTDMAILEEFFKKNNFDEPQTLIESMWSKY